MTDGRAIDSKEMHQSFLRRALELANEAALADEVPVGALIVREGMVISVAANDREATQRAHRHAEIIAMELASEKLSSWRLNGCTLYVTLEPCLMCLAAAQQARIDRIFYGVSDPKGGAVSLGFLPHQDPRMNHRFEVTLLDTPECGAVLSTFFKKKRGKLS